MTDRQLYIIVKHTNEMACVVCYSLDEAIKWIYNDCDLDWGAYKVDIVKEEVEYSPYNLLEIYKVVSRYSHMVMATYRLYRKNIDVEKLILFS